MATAIVLERFTRPAGRMVPTLQCALRWCFGNAFFERRSATYWRADAIEGNNRLMSVRDLRLCVELSEGELMDTCAALSVHLQKFEDVD